MPLSLCHDGCCTAPPRLLHHPNTQPPVFTGLSRPRLFAALINCNPFKVGNRSSAIIFSSNCATAKRGPESATETGRIQFSYFCVYFSFNEITINARRMQRSPSRIHMESNGGGGGGGCGCTASTGKNPCTGT